MEGTTVADAIAILQECGQEALVAKINAKESAADKEAIANQILTLNKVTPTGLKNYCERGRKLLAASKEGKNAFDEYKPEVPTGVFLKPGEELLDKYEALGLEEL